MARDAAVPLLLVGGRAEPVQSLPCIAIYSPMTSAGLLRIGRKLCATNFDVPLPETAFFFAAPGMGLDLGPRDVALLTKRSPKKGEWHI